MLPLFLLLLVLVASVLCGPVRAQEPLVAGSLQCYGMYTQIGTVARREFTDARGFVAREEFYTSPDAGGVAPPHCDEGSLRLQSVRIYTRDAAGRIREEVVGLDTWRLGYDGDDERPSRRTLFVMGHRRYEIRYVNGIERSHIYFDGDGRVAAVNGVLPADLVLALEWGDEIDGWSVGVGLEFSRGGRAPEVHVHLRNRTTADTYVGYDAALDIELRNEDGTLIDRPGPPPSTRSPDGGRTVRVRSGGAAFRTYALESVFGVLPPGRYSLLVRHPHPATDGALTSRPAAFEVTD